MQDLGIVFRFSGCPMEQLKELTQTDDFKLQSMETKTNFLRQKGLCHSEINFLLSKNETQSFLFIYPLGFVSVLFYVFRILFGLVKARRQRINAKREKLYGLCEAKIANLLNSRIDQSISDLKVVLSKARETEDLLESISASKIFSDTKVMKQSIDAAQLYAMYMKSDSTIWQSLKKELRKLKSALLWRN